ncbi:hypothetical protein [Algoriphagus sp. oki45]|uniref:hypothetical protein n=1 Tax=Algoriphagus sp. oki45 TaxID=3067294 RepID=UPI0030C70A6F
MKSECQRKGHEATSKDQGLGLHPEGSGPCDIGSGLHPEASGPEQQAGQATCPSARRA